MGSQSTTVYRVWRLVLGQWRRDGGEETHRLVGLDVARCLALVGMMTAHILPKVIDEEVPWQQSVVSGRASGLFAVLAGTSLALMSGGSVPYSGRRRWRISRGLAVRALLITILGLGLVKLHDAGLGVILPYYGLLFLLGIPFLGMRARQLFLLAAGWAVILPVLSQLVRPLLPAPSSEKLSQMNPEQLLVYLGIVGDYPAIPWLAMLFAGMGVGRLALERPRTLRALGAAGASLAVVATTSSDLITSRPSVRETLLATWPYSAHPTWASIEVAMGGGLSGTTPTGSWWWLAVVAPHSGTPFDFLQTIGCALLVVATTLFLARYRPRVWQVVFGAGAMTLTMYSLHLVMLRPDTWPDIGTPRFWPEVAVVLILGAVFALLHLRGPIEGLVTTASRLAAGRGLRR